MNIGPRLCLSFYLVTMRSHKGRVAPFSRSPYKALEEAQWQFRSCCRPYLNTNLWASLLFPLHPSQRASSNCFASINSTLRPLRYRNLRSISSPCRSKAPTRRSASHAARTSGISCMRAMMISSVDAALHDVEWTWRMRSRLSCTPSLALQLPEKVPALRLSSPLCSMRFRAS